LRYVTLLICLRLLRLRLRLRTFTFTRLRLRWIYVLRYVVAGWVVDCVVTVAVRCLLLRLLVYVLLLRCYALLRLRLRLFTFYVCVTTRLFYVALRLLICC